MFMRYLGGGIGHRIWHLLPQPPSNSPDKEPPAKRVRRAHDTEVEQEVVGEPEEFHQSDEEEQEDEVEDFGYGAPEAIREADKDWEDEKSDGEDDDENNGLGPEDAENKGNNLEMRGFAEL